MSPFIVIAAQFADQAGVLAGLGVLLEESICMGYKVHQVWWRFAPSVLLLSSKKMGVILSLDD